MRNKDKWITANYKETQIANIYIGPVSYTHLERMRIAHSAQLPELQIGLKGGFVGQPVVWERGLSCLLYTSQAANIRTF